MELRSAFVAIFLLFMSSSAYASQYYRSTDWSRQPFRNYLSSLARGSVRLGLGTTLPEIQSPKISKNDLLDTLLQMLVLSSKMSTVQEKFKEFQVDTDLHIVAPSNKAEVVYDSGVKAELGNVLTPTLVQNQPSVNWPVEDGALYTLIKTDPDAPSRSDPKWGEWRHWLVVNIPGTDIAKGEVAVEFVGAGPPKDTGLHRYCFLVFKQPGPLTYTDPVLGMTPNGRAQTKVRDLVTKYNLGDPVAGNFFLAEYDDYVPKLYEKLKG